jgi:hypothetical protein
MTEEPNLKTRVEALAGDTDSYDGASRIIAREGGMIALQAILEEIDVAVLPSILTFQSDAGQLSVDVAGRRLNTVLQFPDGLSSDVEPGAALSLETEEDVGRVGALLKSYALAGDILRVHQKLVPDTGASAGTGLSAAAMAQSLQTQISENPVRDFLDAVGNLFGAAILLHDADVGEMLGEADDVAQLKPVAQDHLSALEAKRQIRPAIHTSPHLTTLDDAMADGKGIGLVVSDSDAMVFTYKTDDLTKLHAAWIKLL